MPRRSPFFMYAGYFMLIVSYVVNVASAQQSGKTILNSYETIPDSLLSLQEYRPDPSAPFIYALKELDVSFENDEKSIVAVLDYHVRVKVFDASAREASIVAIPYYFDNDIEQVEFIKGATYTRSGRRIPLPENAIRTININSRYNVKEFTMPRVSDGSVLEYRYRIRRRYIEELPDFFLAHQVPTALARVSISYPNYLRYSAVAEDFDGKVHRKTEQIDTSSVAKVFTIPQPDPAIRETWTAYRVPAIEEEAFISSLDDYRGKLKFQLSEFGLPRQRLENSWDFVVAELRRERNVLRMIGNNKQAYMLGKSIKGEFDNKKAAQDSIFRFLNARTKFSGAKTPYSDTPDKAVLSGEPADQAAINQTLLAMLQGAGINSCPALISTREFGQINKSFPSFFQFNGLLAYSQIDGKTYYMDASFPHSQPNLIPIDTYNETGLLLKPKSYEWIEIKPSKSLFSISINVDASLDSHGNLSGTIQSESSGYPAQTTRQKYKDGKSIDAIIKESVFDGYSEVGLSDTRMSNLDSYHKPVTFNSSFMLENYATSFTDGLKFRPMVVGFLMSNPFNEGRRDLPVTLDAPEKLDLVYEIKIPSGYTVQSGNQNRKIELPGASFVESYNFQDRTITYEFHIDISQKRFERGVYPLLLDLYKRWVELSNSSWLIKKEV